MQIHDGPYNDIANWNYVRLAEALDNGRGRVHAVQARRVGAAPVRAVGGWRLGGCVGPASAAAELRPFALQLLALGGGASGR